MPIAAAGVGPAALAATSGLAANPAAPTGPPGSVPNVMNVNGTNAAQFREIHKNTWLKRLTSEGRKITVGPKKSDRSWVVFCVHDDTEALLEGYIEPRQAPCHTPEWVVSLQNTLHISHALIPNSHEFEFVVTLSNEVVRFHAMSWEIMQEWVETLRSKLREMKILSPRENLYTKLPEIRLPLLPTRDPTSPLPAPPPVPAALVPGVERVVPPTTAVLPPVTDAASGISHDAASTNAAAAALTGSSDTPGTSARSLLSAMSNTLTQNLLNMLSDPISTYSEQLNDEAEDDDGPSRSRSVLSDALDDDNDDDDDDDDDDEDGRVDDSSSAALDSLLRRNQINVHPNSDNSVRVDVGTSHQRVSADQLIGLDNLLQCERLIPRPQTSRSLSAGAVEKSRRRASEKSAKPVMTADTKTFAGEQRSNNITELKINTDTTPSAAVFPTTPPSASAESIAADAPSQSNITIIQVSTPEMPQRTATSQEAATPTGTPMHAPPPLPPPPSKHRQQTTPAEVFKFPETHLKPSTPPLLKHHEYKSNVQIIPSKPTQPNSKISNTIQVLPNDSNRSLPGSSSCSANAVRQPSGSAAAECCISTAEAGKGTTTVHLTGGDDKKKGANTTTTAIYGTCYGGGADGVTATAAKPGTPNLTKKIILTAHTSGVTNIAVNNGSSITPVLAVAKDIAPADLSTTISTPSSVDQECAIRGHLHYDKVFLSSSIPISPASSTTVFAVTPSVAEPKDVNGQPTAAVAAQETASLVKATNKNTKEQAKVTLGKSLQCTNSSTTAAGTVSGTRIAEVVIENSPVAIRRRVASPTVFTVQRPTRERATSPPAVVVPVQRPPFLTRGLTEAVITMRPSRKDFHFLKQHSSSATKKVPSTQTQNNGKSALTSNNNDHNVAGPSNGSGTAPTQPQHAALNRTHSESLEQRRRSSSTSDAHTPHRNMQRNCTNNNEQPSISGGQRLACANFGPLRIQQPPQPFRSVENGQPIVSGMSSPPGKGLTSPGTGGGPGGASGKRITLREQQVLQLRREIMHPGGVRLQLRRKDCIGSIAWVDAFGAVWVAGWKQKEHPVLYNALHIGDQLLTIAGMAVTTATEASKIIRNANTLFVEVLVRRLPFGRGYAIRRDREGQCLGLIRDGNSATIVDVVPNSLAARHGLPPKAQSCDGSTLTFWILTEINGRPLNLFFKDNEIRDRLNAVGRDISILVQPADLVTKLKKQLKSLRSYKDYLVQ